MNRKPSSLVTIVLVVLAAFAGIALAAQDRYTLKLGELSFSDFRGYENWKVIAVSQTETLLKVIVANDVMMDAYKQGLPAAGNSMRIATNGLIRLSLRTPTCPRRQTRSKNFGAEIASSAACGTCRGGIGAASGQDQACLA
jgi:hypothetical protein